jgi:ABC-2 type transport system permease protein
LLIFVYSLSVLGMIFLPIVVAVVLRRRFVVPWWLFCVGMLTFVVAQLYHIPLNRWLADLGIIGPVTAGHPGLWRTALVLGLSAGISETLARVVAYWLLFRRHLAERWEDSVMVGLGHGGIEAMVFGGVITAATLTSLLGLQGTDLTTLELSAEQLAYLTQQLATLTAAPANAILPLLERAIALTLHVVLSLLVWLAFKRHAPWYVLLAVLYHSLVDATAVLLSQRLENLWLLEGALLLLVLPGLAWAWLGYKRRLRERPERHRPMALSTSYRLFLDALRKELLQQWRTKRVLVVAVVFLIFGSLSPLIARFTPELLRSIEGAEQFAELIPDPTTADAILQYIENLTQFGFIIVLLLGMSAVVGEKEQGTAAIILSKPLPRAAFVLSKFVAQATVYLLGFLLAGIAAYYYTRFLFEPLAVGAFLFGNLLLWVWLLCFAAVTLLGSVLGRTTGMAVGFALAGAVLLLLAGGLPTIGALFPSGLLGWASQLGLDTAVSANGGTLAGSVVVIVVCLVTAVAIFEVQEL